MITTQLEGGGQHECIVQEALRRGIDVKEANDGNSIRRTLLIQGECQEELVQGIPQSWVNKLATLTCDRKQDTKELFGKLAIQAPRSIRFQRLNELNPDLFTKKREFICKPEIGTNGKGVSFDMNSWLALKDYLNEPGAPAGPYLLEEYISGVDLRVQVIGGRMVAACIRHPAFVIGDGKSTLQDLIENRREQIRRQNPANSLTIDAQSAHLIKEAGYTMSSVVETDVRVSLKRVANMGQGAIAEDCTDLVDPRIELWIDQLRTALDMPYFALDILTDDVTRFESYFALEVNLRAEWMHHTFSEGRQHDLASVVIQELFRNK